MRWSLEIVDRRLGEAQFLGAAVERVAVGHQHDDLELPRSEQAERTGILRRDAFVKIWGI